MVQAIASQTARSTSSPVEFAGDFSARRKSLASSLDLQVRQDWRGVSAPELVQSQLGHYGEPSGGQLEMGGPDLLLTPVAAQYLGMALRAPLAGRAHAVHTKRHVARTPQAELEAKTGGGMRLSYGLLVNYISAY